MKVASSEYAFDCEDASRRTLRSRHRAGAKVKGPKQSEFPMARRRQTTRSTWSEQFRRLWIRIGARFVLVVNILVDLCGLNNSSLVAK